MRVQGNEVTVTILALMINYLVGCSGEKQETPWDTISQAYCNQIAACKDTIGPVYPSIEICKNQMLSQVTYYYGGDTVADKNKFSACLEAIKSTCIVDSGTLSTCSESITGSTPIDSCCMNDKDCKPELICVKSGDMHLGVCKQLGKEGEECSEQLRCATDLYCKYDQEDFYGYQKGVCAITLNEGENCSSNTLSCGEGLFCRLEQNVDYTYEMICRKASQKDESCSYVDGQLCDKNLFCVNGVCSESGGEVTRIYKYLGEACQWTEYDSDPCFPTLTCVVEPNTVTGVCTANATEIGAACSVSSYYPTAPGCALLYGLSCDEKTKTCLQKPSNYGEQACSEFCDLTKGLVCRNKNPLDENSAAQCMKRAEVGELCNPDELFFCVDNTFCDSIMLRCTTTPVCEKT